MFEKYEFGDKNADIVLIQFVDNFDLSNIEEEIKYIKQGVDIDFKLVAFKVNNWNNDLSPWPSPAVFGKADFKGNGDETLKEVLRYCSNVNKKYIIGGYSLSGLFALWASYYSDVFLGVASASSSLWFNDFVSFMKTHITQSKHIYLSLGKKEHKTRNILMNTVLDNINEAKEILTMQKIDLKLEFNEGNHFTNPALRTAKAFIWTINRIKI